MTFLKETGCARCSRSEARVMPWVDRGLCFTASARISLGLAASVPETYQTIVPLQTDLVGGGIAVDQPYTIGEVRREERYIGLFPVHMGVEATAELGLKRHTATGFLSFNKRLYN